MLHNFQYFPNIVNCETLYIDSLESGGWSKACFAAINQKLKEIDCWFHDDASVDTVQNRKHLHNVDISTACQIEIKIESLFCRILNLEEFFRDLKTHTHRFSDLKTEVLTENKDLPMFM